MDNEKFSQNPLPSGGAEGGSVRRDGEFAPGERFADRYEIVNFIGGGSYGKVYKAKDTALKRTVALKILRIDAFDEKALKDDKARFVREAVTAAALTHPHIATIYDAGESGELPYIAMEYVEGRTLRDILLNEGALPLKRSVSIFRQIAATLAYAHAHGIVHRDIKPGNILLTAKDEVKLADFGLAKIYHSRADRSPEHSPLTKEGTIVGTVQYLAPEYIRGEAIDDKTDTYAMGAVFYEMLAGEPPFDAPKIVDILQMHLNNEPRPLREASKIGNIPQALEILILRMLSKARSERPPAAEISLELDRIQAFISDETSKTLVIDAPKTEALPEEMPHDPFVGRVIGGCKILEVLGEGGMGAVYKARHLQLGTNRAIKIIHKDLTAQPGFYDRFKNEALLAERLAHPNLVTLYDFSRLEDGSIYTVWEYVEGESIESRLKRTGPFSSRETVRIITEVLSGLAVAHGKGVAHRDIALDNIMLVSDEASAEKAKLIDFGIAKNIRAPEDPAKEAGIILVKVGYSSPEQIGALGKGTEIDFRTDIFSIGVSMFRMLTGQFPFNTSSLDNYIRDITASKHEALSKRFPARVPVKLRDAILKCLSIDRQMRFQSVEELSDVLRQIDYGELIGKPRRTMWNLGMPVWVAFVIAFAVAGAVLLYKQDFLKLDQFLPTRAKPMSPATSFMVKAEDAFDARAFFAPPQNNALYWAEEVARTEENDVYLGAMKKRIAAQLVEDGNVLLRSRSLNDIERARNMFLKASELDPDNLNAKFGLSMADGAAALLRGNLEEARAHFENAKAINPLSPDLRLWLAELHRALSDRYAEAGDLARAKNERDEALFLNPGLAPSDFKLTQIDAVKQPPAEKPLPKPKADPEKKPVVPVKPVIKEEPPPPPLKARESTDPAVYNNLGNDFFNKGRYKEAEEQFKIALSLDPENSLINMNIANLYYTTGKTADAKRYYEKVLAREPNNPKALYYLGIIANESGKPLEAEKLLREAIMRDPDKGSYRFALGSALQNQNRFQEAEREFNRALELGFRDAVLWTELGHLYLSTKRHKEAQDAYLKAIEMAPGEAYTYYNAGMAYLEAKQLAEARAYFEQALKIKPEYALANFQMGNIHWQQKRFSDAKFRYEKAIASNPRYGQAFYNLSLVNNALGETAEAEANRRKACELGIEVACPLRSEASK